MPVYTTEIASDKITSDNPIHQRLLKPYLLVANEVKGKIMEVGCGEGRGVKILTERAEEFTAIDKIQRVLDRLGEQYPNSTFIQGTIPPFPVEKSDYYDYIVSFQVIEHIRQDADYLREIYRILKPGGKAFLTTPNKKRTLTRNPWHIREYTAEELSTLASGIFDNVEVNGIGGNDKIEEYYRRNRESVKKITRWDILNLQYNLPSWMLRVPYDLLNRLNRNKLQESGDELVRSITHEDYLLFDNPENALDLYLILKK